MANKQMSIRSILQQEIERKGFNLSQFSRYSDINRGTLSQVLNGNPPQLPSIADLDRLATVTAYSQEQLYALYIEDCFREEALHGKRLKNVLYRCVELNLNQLIQTMMQRLLAYPSQSKSVYDMAEHWYDEGHRQMLIPLYEYVTISEKYRSSDRIAISRYRIFQLSQTNNFEHNLHAAIAFEPYRNELPIGYRLDGLLKLANIYFNQHLWKKVEQFADELRELATSAYEHRLHMQENIDGERGLETERHLVVYYGHGYLLKGNALEKQGVYEEAMMYIEGYRDLGWFEGLDSIGVYSVEKFSIFAEANFLGLQVLLGNEQYLLEYVKFLEKFPEEILPGLITILQVSNKYEFEIDYIINKFSFILAYNGEDTLMIDDYYSIFTTLERYEHLYRQLAIYYFQKGEYADGLHYISKCLEIANRINKKSDFIEYPELLHLLKEWSVLLSQQKNM
ncbi:DNA-binding protein [Paenibacillus campi]|uniref:helix-turn-helix domain-containing protein n=1 Tax=Paenibacillus campi TaxID=3106031 RepID=UPI002AFE3149|nr:DNA-binding protein [Paenibacillus sp. SGZ-1009]